jgi:hypothetical protein
MIQTKNVSRPAASWHAILMGAIGVAITAALGLPVVLVASHELAAQNSSTRSQQGQAMGAVTTRNGQADRCPGFRSD